MKSSPPIRHCAESRCLLGWRGGRVPDHDGEIFFTANNGISGTELWKSDGTEAGTVLVKDIVPGGTSSNPNNLTSVGGTLIFAANDPATGTELWKSDGTAAGTVPAKRAPEWRGQYRSEPNRRHAELPMGPGYGYSVTVSAWALRDDPCNPGQLMLAVGGTVGDDALLFRPAGPGGGIELMINNASQGTFASPSRLVAYGQAGNDDLHGNEKQN